MTTVAGIDFSSHAIDVVHVDLDDLAPPRWDRFVLAGQDAFDRTRSVRAAMPTASYWADVLAVGIEHPAGRFGTGALMRVQGAVLACLPAGVLVKAWPPGSWRKAVGLPGNASKSEVQAWAWNDLLEPRNLPNIWLSDYRRDIAAWPQDACDAYCIALATRSAIETKEAA